LAGSPRSSAMSGEDAAISQPFYVRGERCLKEAIYLRLALSQIGCGSSGGKADAHLWDTSGCLSSRWSGYPREPTDFPQPQQIRPSLLYSMNGCWFGRVTDVRVQERSCHVYDAARSLDRHRERRPEDRPYRSESQGGRRLAARLVAQARLRSRLHGYLPSSHHT
jgi:hypothetical protein